jgi:antitoxin (DNA-binding transcriptional repressor) of toxin-antitoxin stability system
VTRPEQQQESRMKTMNIRELRQTPRLRDTLAREGEVLVVSNGEPIARMMPIKPATAGRPKLPSLKAFRDAQPVPKTPVEQLIREERDRR